MQLRTLDQDKGALLYTTLPLQSVKNYDIQLVVQLKKLYFIILVMR